MTVAPSTLREVMSSWVTGIAVITTSADGELHGMTLNSLTSVSLVPPLLLVCLSSESRTATAIRHSKGFVINILDEASHRTSNRFSLPGGRHFSGTEHFLTARGLPVLSNGCLAYLECEAYRVLDGGDHDIVLGRVIDANRLQGRPLAFFRSQYCSIERWNPPETGPWYG